MDETQKRNIVFIITLFTWLINCNEMMMCLMQVVMQLELQKMLLLIQENRRRRALRRGRYRARRYVRLHIPESGVLFDILRGNTRTTKENLRVNPATLQLLVRKIESRVPKRHGCDQEIEAIIFLFWLACGTSYRVIGATFNMPRPTVFRVTNHMLDTLVNLFSDVISKPKVRDYAAVGAGFCRKAGSDIFRNCLGALDGSHVRSLAPMGKQDQYCDRKQTMSVQMQALCDSTGKIIDFFVGAPGSVHDSRVLKFSSLYRSGNYPPAGYFIIGDSGYPCRLNPIALIPTFKSPATNAERAFNLHHSRARIIIERVFGMMKARWRFIFTKTIEQRIRAGDVLLADRRAPVRFRNDIDDEAPGTQLRNQLVLQLVAEKNIQ